jgi:hydrogenase small subunit
MVDDGLYAALVRRGMSRRAFLKFTAAMAAALALPPSYAPQIARALENAKRLPVIWLRGQDCAGQTEAFLRAADPSTAMLLLETLALEYHETLMAPAGDAATLARTAAMEKYPDGYVLVVEGSIPTAAGGAYCLVGGRPFVDIVREVADGAMATIAVGACACDGGVASAGGLIGGNPTGASSLADVVSGAPTIALPGCPLNVENLVATIVHFLTFGEWPPTDLADRPLFAYGPLIHNECERRPHFEFGEFSLAWGDEGAQKGWCLYKVGCKGPESFGNCASVRFAEGVSWPIRAGHGCIGCTMPHFWDSMSPFYVRLPAPMPTFPAVTVDVAGGALLAGVAGIAALHGTAMYAVQRRRRAGDRRAGETAAEGGTTAEMAAVDGSRAETADVAGSESPAEAVTAPSRPGEAPSPPTADDGGEVR